MIKVVGFVHVKPQSKMDDDVWGTYVSGNQPIVLMDDETIFLGLWPCRCWWHLT